MAGRFAHRAEAGRQLAHALEYVRGEDVVVLGLPRGGVPVAFEVARTLGAPLDVLVVRKLGVPVQPELAMGAVGEDGVRVLNDDVLRMVRLRPNQLAAVERTERAEVQRRLAAFRGGRPREPVAGRVAVVVDDGIATGSTARVACRVARAHGARRVILAVPVASAATLRDMADVADEVVCVQTPAVFFAIGEFYDDFTQTSDDEVVALLRRAAADLEQVRASGPPGSGEAGRTFDGEMVVTAGGIALAGQLSVSAVASAIVIFAHGSGSNRHSPRDRVVARALNDAGIGTLLIDLLTPLECDRRPELTVEVLALRLADAVRWLREQPVGRGRSVGLYGASTGAAVALWAATEPDTDIGAVVSRGGRPDLASARLEHVTCPTLLIVGALDPTVLALNEAAQARLRCPHRLAVVSAASHLFEEPGTLAQAATLARDYFAEHLRAAMPISGDSG